MILRECSVILRGNLVGREGLEPSTKRLRVGSLKGAFPQISAQIPLSLWPENPKKHPPFSEGLRDPEPGSAVTYSSAGSPISGAYLGRYGSRRLILISAQGGPAGLCLRYVSECAITPNANHEAPKAPAGRSRRRARPYTADNGHSKSVAADETSRALRAWRLPDTSTGEHP